MKKNRLIAVVFLSFYLFFRFVASSFIDRLGPYASYIFEIAFAGTVLFYYRRKIKFLATPSAYVFKELVVSIALGFVTYLVTKPLKLTVPFDFNSGEFLFFLLILGPALEEALFRGALFLSIEEILKKKKPTLIASAALFAFAHFYSFFFVLIDIQSFVLFQTFYTFLLGLWWGHRFQQTRAYSTSWLLHVFFNFGFWGGWVLLHFVGK